MNNTSDQPSPINEPKRRGRFADFFIRLLKEKPLGMLGGVIILLLIGISLFADVLAPYPYNKIHLRDRMQEASAQYLLGTDHVGRDLLSRLIHGARISLGVGLAATTINVLVALLVGGVSGFLGGKLDLAMQRLVDAWIAFPGLLLLLTIMSIVGQGLLQLILVLGIAGGVEGSRVVRGAVIAIIVKATSSRTNLDWKKTVKKLILNNIFLDHSVRFLTDFTIKMPQSGIVLYG